MNETVLIKVDGIEVKTTKFTIEATKIAKKHDISMFFCNEKRIEIAEIDRSKATRFIKEVKKINEKVEVIDLRFQNQHLNSKGYDIRRDKALYLVDDKHYRELIGENVTDNQVEQVTMF